MQNDINNLETKLVNLRKVYVNLKKDLYNNIELLEEKYKNSNMEELIISNKTAYEIESKINSVASKITNQMLLELKEHFRITKTTAPFENRKIKRFSKKVIDILETSFRSDRYPSEEEKNRIANLCLISVKQVNNWFTNKRNRSKQYDVNIYRDY